MAGETGPPAAATGAPADTARLDGAAADSRAACPGERETGGTAQPCSSSPERRLIQIEWVDREGWCSETANIRGTTQNWGDGENVSITVNRVNPGAQVASFQAPVSGNQFTHAWQVLEVLPPRQAGHYVERMPVNGHAEGQTTATPLELRFIPNAPRTNYHSGNANFDLSAADYEMRVERDVEYVKGWGGEVVSLGASVPATTGGLLDGQYAWSGYRWMKQVGLTRKYWDGSAWQDLPAGFVLADSNNIAVGFYLDGTAYRCQQGGTWPEAFTDWDINAADKQQKIRQWEESIRTTWTGKFDIKRRECRSSETSCCRYSVRASASFLLRAAFSTGMLVVADGNIRSSTALFFIDDPDLPMAAHEFGHYMGNPDEYDGATSLDASLNEDGAVNGIDEDSIMGQNMTRVKRRHFRTVCQHFGDMVRTNCGKSYTYEAVALASAGGGSRTATSAGGGSRAATIAGGVLLGALAGAATGALVGYLAGGDWQSAAVGAGTGALAGAVLGGVITGCGGGLGAAVGSAAAAGAVAGLAVGLTRRFGVW
jgi:hypothetical protein